MTKLFSIKSILIVILFFCTTNLIPAPMIVNIDNPSFRKISVAVPTIITSTKSELSTQIPQELSKLLTFSRLFNVVSSAAFSDLEKTLNNKKILSFIDAPSTQKLSSLKLDSWKSSGIETLILGKLTYSKKIYSLSIICIDLNKRAVVLGKKYSNINDGNYVTTIRKFADSLLKEYTGKPGIFSSKIVFVGKEKSSKDNKQIYVCDFDGSNVKRISHKLGAIHLSPSWSHDGRYISYTSYENGSPDIYVYDTKNKTTKRLISSPGLDSGSNWSHNDQLIAYTTSKGSSADIFISDLSGNKRAFIQGSGLDVDPKFSPDGQKFAFVSGRFGNPHIFVADIMWKTSTNPVVTAEKRITFAGWYNATPSWSYESDKIVFAGFDKDINRFDLFIVNPDGRNLERLTLNNGDNESPSFSPNSQLIVFQSNRIVGSRGKKGKSSLYMMSRDGADQRIINTGLYESFTPSWSPQIIE